MIAPKNDENIENKDPIDLPSDEKTKKHQKYFSNCCYFSSNMRKKSLYCLDTVSSTTKKDNNLQNFEINRINQNLKVKDFSTINQIKNSNNQEIFISQSNSTLFNDFPEFVQIDNKIFSQLQESFINQISRESIIEIENKNSVTKESEVKETKKINSICMKRESDTDSNALSFSEKKLKEKDEANHELDLYNLQLIEEKYSLILDGLKGSQNVAKYCKEWWTLTNNIGFMNLNVIFNRILRRI